MSSNTREIGTIITRLAPAQHVGVATFGGAPQNRQGIARDLVVTKQALALAKMEPNAANEEVKLRQVLVWRVGG